MRPISKMSVLVTGGGSGIGEGIARHFCAAGARVTISGRRADKVDHVATSLGDNCRAVVGDITIAADRLAMTAAAVEHGNGRLDVLVNNAGNMYRGPLAELDEQKLMDVFHSNVIGAMMLSQAALQHLVDSSGAIVFMGSVHSQRAFPGASPYAATKGALETLTGVLAAELGPQGVRVSCVRPGGVFTEINQRAGLFDDDTARQRLESLAPAHALGRLGTVEEIAEAVEYLARAQWATGNVLTIDGGLGLGVTNA
ncbi:SDR family NAD(P)-dependent oxidoreductase [Ilumatobacter sp.]|jgi:NAD(P)-dependent dehydrogenase (short-subunit alcohol dehydrogenase family)|uniref:SDR family NAD(P)-dependent oxidoreductase n=2 Tax=Ilumatobacter sp. TaxID=1967498 RepID=UPI003753E787